MSNTTTTIESLLNAIKSDPNSIEFQDVIEVIGDNYHYSPSAFTNGAVVNAVATNEGSCKLIAFAKLNQLNESETLALFGKYYREDVLLNPNGDDHQNIRSFMESGWEGISFDSFPLEAK